MWVSVAVFSILFCWVFFSISFLGSFSFRIYYFLAQNSFHITELISVRYGAVAGAVSVLGAILFKEKSLKGFDVVPVNEQAHSFLKENEQLQTNIPVDYIAKIRNLNSLPKPYTELRKNNFTLNYNNCTRIANYAMEIMLPNNVVRNPAVNRKKSDFVEDSDIVAIYKSTHNDYKSSGYDRGHLVASGNYAYDQKALNETFVYSNVAPQVRGFQRKWDKLEKIIRNKMKNCKSIRICTGPLFPAKVMKDGSRRVEYPTIGEHDVAVPPFFYKVIIYHTDAEKFELESYVFPNEEINLKTPWEKFYKTREEIAHVAGHFPFPCWKDSAFHKINGEKMKKADLTDPRNKGTNKEEDDLPDPDTELIMKDFVSNYDHRTRIPNYTMEIIHPDSVRRNSVVDCENPDLYKNSTVEVYFQSTIEDYEKAEASGFIKGYLASPRNHTYDQEAFNDSYYLTNAAPQLKAFNEGVWRRLENNIYDRVEDYEWTYICTGPLFPPENKSDGKRGIEYQTVGDNDVAVAPFFFKVVVFKTYDGKKHLESYVLPHVDTDEDIPLEKFFESREYIAKVAGLMPFGCWGDEVFASINEHTYLTHGSLRSSGA